MKNLMTGVILLCAVGAGAYALPSLAQFTIDIPAPAAAFSEVMEGYQYMLGGRVDGEVSLTTTYDPGQKRWSFLIVSEFFKNTAICDARGRIVSGSTEVLSGELADRMGMDRRIMEIRNSSLSLLTMRNGKKMSERRIALDKPIFDIDSMPVLLTELLKSSEESFNSDIVLKSKGWRVNVNFQHFKTSTREIVEETRGLPEAYTRILSGYGTGFHCYRMQAAGILGVLDSTKYYFLFADDESRRFVGFWGGRGDMAEGIIFKNTQSLGS